MTISRIVNGTPEKIFLKKKSFGPKKGSARSRSATRGYDKQFGDKSFPFRQQNEKFICRSCSNKTESGQKVKGHMAGGLICPNVQSKKYPVHGSWIKFKEEFPNLDWSRAVEYSNDGKGKDSVEKERKVRAMEKEKERVV